MIFVGDVHGEFEEYRRMLDTFGKEPSIQLGDMGIGFPGGPTYSGKSGHMFLRGNHDNPQACRDYLSYLGDYGFCVEIAGYPRVDPGVFFVSGAATPDFYPKRPHINWWEDEQLCRYKMDAVLGLYERTKPKIVATHDCPLFLLDMIYPPSRRFPTATGKLFDAMFEIYQPTVWVFGHHHRSLHFTHVKGTEFFGLGILEAMRIAEVEVQSDRLGDDV